MSATRSARVATSRSWASVFSSWVPKMVGWCTPSRRSVDRAGQFNGYLRSMLRYCLLWLGVLPAATAPVASQHADTLRERLEARIARAPAQAVGLYYRNLARPDSILIGANLRLHAASTMKSPGHDPDFPGCGRRAARPRRLAHRTRRFSVARARRGVHGRQGRRLGLDALCAGGAKPVGAGVARAYDHPLE